MTDKNKIISRVKKLLAMANDVGSPEEAVIAARRARSLMDKYQIKEFEVEQFKDKSKFGTVRNEKAYRYTPQWMEFLGHKVAEWNDCQMRKSYDYDAPLTRGGQLHPHVTMTFCGLEADAITAKAMFEYFCDTIIRLSKNQGFGSNARAHNSFKLGATVEVLRRIDKIIEDRKEEMSKNTGTGLVVVKQQLVEAEFGVQRFRKVRMNSNDPFAEMSGREAGKKINLHTQVGGNNQERLK